MLTVALINVNYHRTVCMFAVYLYVTVLILTAAIIHLLIKLLTLCDFVSVCCSTTAERVRL